MRRSAELDGAELDLTRREFDLLTFLAGRPGVVVARKELLAEVWQQSYGDDQTIDVHLSWLRRKLGETAARPRYLHTLRGVGVKLQPCGRRPGRCPGRYAGHGAARMRWALVKVCLAVTAMVVIAFAVPLGLVIREMASDRAFSDAERQAAMIAPTLSITTDREELTRAVLSTEPGDRGRLAVHVPAEGGPLDIGTRRATPKDVATVRKAGRASITEVTGGFALLQPTALGTGDIAVVEVFVPEGEVSHGVATAWLMLAGVGVALIVGSVAVADRLGVRMVQPAQRLAGAAQDLGEGRLGTRVPEEGPTELRSAAVAFNSMADQVVQLLANERELAADLSHRLRTPLTVLRLNAASLGEGPAAEQTRAAVLQLEHEVDTIIRTAREQRPQPQAGQTGRAATPPR